MALLQNTSFDSDALILGNWKIQVATYNSAYTTVASVASAVTNLGLGMVTGFGHNIEKYNVQAGNGPDPVEGVATETFTITADLMEFTLANVVTALGGIVTTATAITTTHSYLSGGGASVMTPKTFLLTNRRIVSGASVETNLVVWKGYATNGPQFTTKADQDADPVTSWALEIEGVLDATRTAGNQLYLIDKWVD